MKSNLYQYLNEESITLFNNLLIKNNTFKEYIDILNKLYKIEITEYDLIKISSLILEDTPKVIILNTNILINVTKQKQIDNHFKYYDHYHKLNIKVAYTNDNILNPKHKYTYNEIINLINKNKIVLLEFIIDLKEDNLYYDDEEYRELFPLNNITYNNFTNAKYISKKYIPYIKTYLDNHFTKEKLSKDKIKKLSKK